MNVDDEESQESILGYANDSSRGFEKRMLGAPQVGRAKDMRKK